MTHPRWLRHLAVWALATTAACGGSGSTGPNPNPNPNPTPTVRNVAGRTDRTLTLDGQSRQFIVYVGNSVGPTTAAPVVFMFHGTSGDGLQYYNISRWKEMADQAGLIAVFPTGLTYCYKEDGNGDGDIDDPVDIEVFTKWTAGGPNQLAQPLCSPAEVAALSSSKQALVNHPVNDDVLFVDAIIALLKEKYLVDPKRIYASGFSNGAQFVDRLAVERSRVFAALAAHAGAMPMTPVPDRAMSFAGTLGNKDEHVVAGLGVPSVPVSPTMLTDYPGIKFKFVKPMLAQLQLADVSTYSETVMAGKRVGQWTYRTSTVGASNSYVFSIIEDNDHSYPNGVLHPIVVAQPLWTFFQTQQLP